MKKSEAVRWEKLEGQGNVLTSRQFTADVKNLDPPSSHYLRKRGKLDGESQEAKKDKL